MKAMTPALEPSHADIVIGVVASQDLDTVSQVADAIEAELRRSFPSHVGEIVLLTAQDGPGPGSSASTHPAVFTGGFLGPESALPALLQAARVLDAKACALVGAEAREPGDEWLRLLLGPIIEQGYDFVCPSYKRHKLAGTINNGIVYPLTRALFGKRLRQPLGGEVALSRRLAEQLLRDEEWESDPVHAGADVWLVTKVLSRGLKICQSFLGPRPEGQRATVLDVSSTLARVVGLLFHEMERHAATWQKIAGSEPVATFGDHLPSEGQTLQVSAERLVEGFELGYRDLRTFWALFVPPADLLALKRLSGQASDAFRFDDRLWAKLVYDFALGYHAKLVDRGQLLKAMTPLYLGWLAGFVNEVLSLPAVRVEERVERICAAFEREKPDLISRWRWPDRFSP